MWLDRHLIAIKFKSSKLFLVPFMGECFPGVNVQRKKCFSIVTIHFFHFHMLVDYLHEFYLKFCSITELLVVSDTLFTNKRDKLDRYSM